MTDRQATLLRFLEQGAGEIANVFRAGALLRGDDAFPARAYFVAHAVREIINKLPDYCRAETTGVKKRRKRSKPAQLRDFAKQWFSATSEEIAAGLTSATPIAEQPNVSIPMALALKIHALATHEVGVTAARRSLYAEFLGKVRGVDPWYMLEAADVLIDIDASGRAHLPEPDELWEESKALALWDQMEDRLYAIVGPRHDIYARIEAQLDKLNAL